MGYISYNRGFKSGGFNVLALGTPAYNPEQLDAYEIGFKSDLLDRHVRLNVARVTTTTIRTSRSRTIPLRVDWGL